MSIQLIQQYYTKAEQMIRYGGTRNESTLRKPVQDLLEQYAQSKNLIFVPEVEYITRTRGKSIRRLRFVIPRWPISNFMMEKYL